MMNMQIVWIRKELRIHDNLALAHAVRQQKPCFVLFIWPELHDSNSEAWLQKALVDFKENLLSQGICLIVKKGSPVEVLKECVEKTGATHIFWNRGYEPEERILDEAVFKEFSHLTCKTFQSNTLFEPGSILTKQQKPYQVFTPFWKLVSMLEPDRPQSISKIALHTPPLSPDHIVAHDEPALWNYWKPTENEALLLARQFAENSLPPYEQMRNFPAVVATSKLSPYLHFGQISVRALWHMLLGCAGSEFFLRELVWREFAIHLLYHFPQMVQKPLDVRFLRFPWHADPTSLKAWQEGNTGYPIVDAGMRELKETGWMHNRVRMIVASFLVKHLLISWQDGADWFMKKLVDADLASNTMNWQWVAGCGPDAAPYFRIFNPILQGQKFDPEGEYVRTFIPELSRVPAEKIHTPWQCPLLAPDYALPIVDHTMARQRALEAFAKIK